MFGEVDDFLILPEGIVVNLFGGGSVRGQVRGVPIMLGVKVVLTVNFKKLCTSWRNQGLTFPFSW